MRAMESTITQKGQVTIPQEIRTRLGLKPRDRVRFAIKDGEVRIIPAPSKILAGYGAVTPHSRPEDFQGARAAFEEGVAEDVQSEG